MAFLIGLVIGLIVGMLLTCLCVAAANDDYRG